MPSLICAVHIMPRLRDPGPCQAINGTWASLLPWTIVPLYYRSRAPRRPVGAATVSAAREPPDVGALVWNKVEVPTEDVELEDRVLVVARGWRRV